MGAVAEDIWCYAADPNTESESAENMGEALDEFKSNFDKESIELQLLEMEGALMNNREEKAEIVQSLFRDVHSLKGTSAMLKIDPLTHFLHIYEDVLGIVSGNVLRTTAIRNAEILDFFLQGLDLIDRIINNLYSQPNYVFKDHREYFGFYIRMIVTARDIVAQPENYLELEELNEDLF